jgi:hypothetical protein
VWTDARRVTTKVTTDGAGAVNAEEDKTNLGWRDQKARLPGPAFASSAFLHAEKFEDRQEVG